MWEALVKRYPRSGDVRATTHATELRWSFHHSASGRIRLRHLAEDAWKYSGGSTGQVFSMSSGAGVCFDG
jgi:hypothetical protein